MYTHACNQPLPEHDDSLAHNTRVLRTAGARIQRLRHAGFLRCGARCGGTRASVHARAMAWQHLLSSLSVGMHACVHACTLCRRTCVYRQFVTCGYRGAARAADLVCADLRFDHHAASRIQGKCVRVCVCVCVCVCPCAFPEACIVMSLRNQAIHGGTQWMPTSIPRTTHTDRQTDKRKAQTRAKK
jgi:hypothetical protein